MKGQLKAAARMTACPVTSFRVARWTWSAQRHLARSLHADGMAAVDQVGPPPAVGTGHRSTVTAVLRLTSTTCLPRAAVLQRWDAAHDRARPLVVGVMHAPDGAVVAHAWLDGEAGAGKFVELHRRPPAP